MTRLIKIHSVRNLYRDPHFLLYYTRSQKGGVNSFVSLNTTRKEQAIKNMEELRGNEFRKRHEIPEEEESRPSPLLGPLLDQYREAGYQIWLTSGGADGNDLQHWLQAEAEILKSAENRAESSGER